MNDAPTECYGCGEIGMRAVSGERLAEYRGLARMIADSRNECEHCLGVYFNCDDVDRNLAAWRVFRASVDAELGPNSDIDRGKPAAAP